MTPKQPPPDERAERGQAPPGFHYEWREIGEARLATEEERATKHCRRAGPGFSCLRPPVIALKRTNGWWLYCDWHSYGRRVHDGRVEYPRLVADEEGA